MQFDSDFFTPLDLAIHATVKEYVDPRTHKRGAVGLAARLGIPSGTLSNKANPSIPEAPLGLKEAIRIQLAADDYRILHEVNAELGHCAYQLPAKPHGSDLEVLDAYVQVHISAGEKALAIQQSLSDGRITQEELRSIRTLFDRRVRAGLELIACLERLAAP